MRMYTSRKSRRSKLPYVIAALAVTAGMIIYMLVSSNGDGSGGDVDRDKDVPGVLPNPDDHGNIKVTLDGGSVTIPEKLAGQIGPSPLTAETGINPEEAMKSFKRAMLLQKGVPRSRELIEARKLLNEAFVSGKLLASASESAVDGLEKLAKMTVLREGPYICDRDPYVMSYIFQPGDLLNSTRYKQGSKRGHIRNKGVIARHDLSVPAAAVVRFNGLESATRFKAGKSYKLIKGPFHLVVSLAGRYADLYIRDLFVKRMKTCTGTPETPTPTGFFCVARGGKTMNSPYNPPLDSNLPNKTIMPGEPGYPLDDMGHNIKLRGIAELGTDISVNRGYAIHGTNQPESIGKMASRGCLRLLTEDIELLYDCLQEYGDPEDPTVPWNHWSVVWIRK